MGEVLIPKNAKGRDTSPIEARTGVVLPIWAPGEGYKNRHHAYFYKRHFMNGVRKFETRAVRLSRLQLVLKSAHNGSVNAFHSHFDGTEFPRDEKQSFGLVVLNCAGYIPPFLLHMSPEGPVIIETTPRMKRVLSQPDTLTIEKTQRGRKYIGSFLMQYAASQRFDHVKQSQIEQFIELGQPKYLHDENAQANRRELGMRLANIGLGMAVDGIDRTYFQARDEDALSPKAPVCAWQVAKDFVKGYELDYFGELEQNLLNQLAVAA